MNISCPNAYGIDDGVQRQWTFDNMSACLKTQESGNYFDYCTGECHIKLLPQRHSDADIYIYGVVFPVLLVFAVLANCIVVAVMSRKQMASNPTNRILLCLAIAELLVGLVPFPYTLYQFTLGNYNNYGAGMTTAGCLIGKYAMDAIPPMLHSIAMLLTVLMAVQRCIVLFYPIRGRDWLRMTQINVLIGLIVCVAVLSALPKMIDRKSMAVNTYLVSHRAESKFRIQHVEGCVTTPTIFLQLLNDHSFYTVYFVIRAIFLVILPCFGLIILTGLMCYGIARFQHQRMRLKSHNEMSLTLITRLNEKASLSNNQIHRSYSTTAQPKMVPQRLSDSSQINHQCQNTNRMLFLLVTIYTIVNLPQGVFAASLVLEHLGNLQNVLGVNDVIRQWAIAVDNMAIMASYPVHLLLYYSMSTDFRENFWEIFGKWRIVFKRTDSSKRNLV